MRPNMDACLFKAHDSYVPELRNLAVLASLASGDPLWILTEDVRQGSHLPAFEAAN
jgi:hypothetical protein